MSWPLYVAIYLTIWWMVIFAVLPFGVRSQHEEGEMHQGTDPGAPVVARMGWKVLWTTVIATVIFALFYVWMEYGRG